MVLTSISVVRRLISGYLGYKEENRKEDDLAVKRHIKSEIEKNRNHLKNILEMAYEKEDMKASESVKGVLDELDVFANEIDMSEAGHRYGFFSTKTGTSLRQLKKLVKFDESMIEQIEVITEASTQIEDAFIEGEELDLQKEMRKIREYVTTTRNTYQDRIQHIKKI